MRTTFACLALVLSASACILHTDDDDVPGPGPAPDGTITVAAGRWYYSETTNVASTCPTRITDGQDPGDFAIDQVSSAGFRVIPEDGTAPFNCTLTGAAFSCPDRASATRDFRSDGIDAVVTIHADARGTFSAGNRASGRQEATASCTGTQCSALGANVFPCDLTVDFKIRTY